MAAELRVFDIFTPTGVPTITYVSRPDSDLETHLGSALQTPGQIVSLAGPSKAGKTVLINKVIPPDNLIAVSGAAIRSPDELWERVLNWMEAPSESSFSSETGKALSADAKAGGKAGVPFVAQGSVEGSVGIKQEDSQGTTHLKRRSGIDQVIKELAGSDYIVFIDDFHYMAPHTQVEVAKQIKEAAEKKVKICTASVPHRNDDVVRSNPELRGRVRAINFQYWRQDELELIANKGFAKMNLGVRPERVSQMAAEAFGSPQLMQQNCLQLCLYLHIDRPLPKPEGPPLNDDDMRRIYEQTSMTTDFTSLVEALHAGPKVHGTRRTTFQLKDGSTGDVYRAILLALAEDPARLTLGYDAIYQRVKKLSGNDEFPYGSAITSSLEQISKLAGNSERGAALEWHDGTLDIIDPYFLFFLRRSPKLQSLGQEHD